MDKKTLGENIRAVRKMREMTRAQLAEGVGVSTDHISHVEIGASSISLPLLTEICSLLEVTPNDILIGEFSPRDYMQEVDFGEAEAFEVSCKDVRSEDVVLLKYMHNFMMNRKNSLS